MGIFVSSSIAKKEHQEIVSTLKAIEALSPGLYEMVIEAAIGEGVEKRFHVAFRERTIPEVIAECGGDDSDRPFAAVARYSELATELYDLTLSPPVRAMSNPTTAQLLAAINLHLLWAAPPVTALGERMAQLISEAPQEDLRTLVQVQDALDRVDQGGFAEGVIRMLILLAHSRKEVRRSRLERSNRMLMSTEPFASMKPKQRTRMIHRESLIVGFEPEAAITALPQLIQGDEDRQRALALCWEIAGPRAEMSDETLAMMRRLAAVLGQTLPAAQSVPDHLRKIA